VLKKILKSKREEVKERRKICRVRSFVTFTHYKYYSSDKIKMCEMDGACGLCRKKCTEGPGGETTWNNLAYIGRVVIKYIVKK
jgi:hypothetical protein